MEYTSNDIRNIAFEKINERFSKGGYLGIEVTIDMTNGYINGNHLANQVKTKGGQSKRFVEWRKTKEADDIIKYLSSCGIPQDTNLLIEIVDVSNELRGTYIHPRLVAHVAQWASPIFADKVAVIINNKAINDSIMEKNIEISSLKETIERIETQNNEQNKKLDQQSKQIEELLNYSRKADEENTIILDELDQISNEAKETNERLEVVQEKLNIAVELRVPKDPVTKRNEIFAIYKKPMQNDYKVIRCQYRSKNASISKCREQLYTEQIYFKEDPNAVNIWNRAKVNIIKIANVSGGYFLKINQNYTEVDLLEFIQSVELEKKEV